MLLVDRQSGTASAGRTGSNPMHLRLRDDGQLVELPLGKTTIGSSPRCSLRIQKPGVQPVHCLIVHGPEGLSVRRWAADTQLNGMPFDDSPLTEGDCLALGGVELELVGAGQDSERSIDVAIPSVSDAGGACDLLMDAMQESVAAVSELEGTLCDSTCELDGTCVPEVEVLSLKAGEWHKAAELEAVKQEAATQCSAEAEVVEAEIVSEPELVEEAIAPTANGVNGVEVVFRALQTACEISRGRSRKMLAALREQRGQNQALSRQLVEAREQLADLNRERVDWEQSQVGDESQSRDWERLVQGLRQEIGDLESRLAEHSQQMSELQQGWITTRSAAVTVGEPAIRYEEWPTNVTPQCLESAPVVAEELEVDAVEVVPPFESSKPVFELSASEWANSAERSVRDWSGDTSNSVVADVEPTSTEIGEADSIASDTDPWNPSAEVSAGWAGAVASHDVELEPARVESQWGASPSAYVADEEDVFGAGTEAESLQVEQPVWAEEAPASTPEETTDEVSPFAGFSIWKQGAVEEASIVSEAETPVVEETAQPSPIWGSGTFGQASSVNEVDESLEQPNVSTPAANLWASRTPEVEPEIEAPAVAPKVPQASFIDRYAHLFADEATNAPEPVVVPTPRSAGESVAPASRPLSQLRNDAVVAPAKPSEDEESIELYMSKLLQRVRGESPHVAGSQVGPSAAAAAEAEAIAAPTMSTDSLTPEVAEAAAIEPETEEEAAQAMVNWEAIARRAVAAGPPTNLGALRALANESARRAIGRHELAKHRRNAVTKVIVSTLAGMTSLWLMLDAPNWLDIQFITACGALIVAAYWAGQTYRALLESMRAASYDRPAGAAAPRQALPIDVEEKV